jgi:hypothetical protein
MSAIHLRAGYLAIIVFGLFAACIASQVAVAVAGKVVTTVVRSVLGA